MALQDPPVLGVDVGRQPSEARALGSRLAAPIRRAATPLALALLVLVACVVPLTFSANWSELNTAPDEAAHYVTSLMIRSYITEGLGTDPRQFAEQYYVRYPKVAFGIWPPLFHVLLGGWLLLTGPSFVAALVFVSVTTVLVSSVVFQSGRDTLGVPLALAGAVWFVTFPAVLGPATSVMMDMLCALFMLLGALAFGQYLDTPSRRQALLFALAAAAALLTKYNALALALVPPVAILLSGRWAVLRRGDFWLMPAVVALLAGPWYATHLDMIHYASQPAPPPGAWVQASLDNGLILTMQVGVLGMPLVALGIHERLKNRPERNGVWCAMFAVLVAVWSFHSLLYPIVGARYLLAPAAALALFGAAGVHVLVTHIVAPTRVAVWHRVRLGAAMLLLVVVATWTPRPRPARGFARAAALVLEAPAVAATTILVSADPIGEGAFVAHVATHAPSRDTTVLRSSKLLASGTWMGLSYSPRYRDPETVLLILDRARVEHVVLDQSSTEPHHRLLDAAVSASPAWRLFSQIPVSTTNEVRIYSRTHPLPPGQPHFELDTSYSLGRNVKR